MQLQYPWSRIATRNCPQCRLHEGRLEASEPVEIGGRAMLPIRCDYCGFTFWFDLEVPRTTPYRDQGTTETFTY